MPALERLGALAARGGAGIEQPPARRTRLDEVADGELGRAVLHADPPVGEPRQRADRDGAIEHEGGRRRGGPVPVERRADEIGRGERLAVRLARSRGQVDAQRHRRLLVVGRRDLAPAPGPVGAERVEEPFGMGEPGGVVEPREQRLAAAQGVSEHRVDEPARPRLVEPACRRHRRVDGGVLGGARVQKLEQAELEEQPHVPVLRLQRALHQHVEQRSELHRPAREPERAGLEKRPVGGRQRGLRRRQQSGQRATAAEQVLDDAHGRHAHGDSRHVGARLAARTARAAGRPGRPCRPRAAHSPGPAVAKRRPTSAEPCANAAASIARPPGRCSDTKSIGPSPAATTSTSPASRIVPGAASALPEAASPSARRLSQNRTRSPSSSPSATGQP